MPNKSLQRRVDIAVIFIVLILAPVLSIFFHARFILSIMLYYGSLSVYFSFRAPYAIKKALLISFASIPACLFLDYMAFYNNAWSVPTIFPFRILGLIPLEDFICLFAVVYALSIVRDHFFETYHEINFRRYKNFWIVIALTIVFLILHKWFPYYLRIPYYYLWLLIVVFIVPSIVGFMLFSKLRRITRIMMPYFFMGMLSWELIALYLGQWSFPSSEYIGLVKFLGFSWPVEEFLVWQILALPAIIAVTEFGVGNEKIWH